MRNVILFDEAAVRGNLLPLTYTRPVALMRQGITTMLEKWQRVVDGSYSFDSEEYLRVKFPLVEAADGDDLRIAAHLHPTPALVEAVLSLTIGQRLVSPDGELLARRGDGEAATVTFDGELRAIRRIWDVFQDNGEAIVADFEAITAGRKSQRLSDTCTLIGDPSQLFIEEGATVEGAIINVKKGPVYVGRDAEIMEGACLRGPIALCEHAMVNMGGKVYGPTTLGPHCKVGGEVNNVVMTGYSNKSHDGFLGNAVIGEWCNLGAGCTASNLKNSYSEVKLWDIARGRFVKTGLQFCGLIMGDHSKAGINTMFNTATIVGPGVSFYGSDFPRTYLPGFIQGNTAGMRPVDMNLFFETASLVMERRHVELTDADRQILTTVRRLIESR